MINTSSANHNIKFYALIAFFILIGYSPIYLSNYAFSDDWFYVYASNTDPNSILKWDVLSGRPLYGSFRYLFSFFINDVNSLIVLRVFSLLSLIALGCYLYSFTSKRQILENNLQRFTFSTMLCLLPSFQVYTAWSVCFPYVLSVIFSGLSYTCLTSHRTSLSRLLLSAIFIVASFAIYQPAGMSFLFFAMIDLCLSKREIDRKIIIRTILMLGLGMFSALLFAKALPYWLYHETLGRTNVTLELGTKLWWFIREPLKNAIANYDLGRTLLSVILSLIIIGIGIAAMKKHGRNKPYLFIFFVLASGLPNLLVSESWAAYRTIVAIALITTAAFIFGLLTIFKNIRYPQIPYVIFILLTVFVSTQNIRNGFSLPQQEEYRLFNAEVLRSVPAEFNGGLYYNINSDNLPRVAKSTKYDEFGALSLGMPWAFAGMAYSVRKEHAMNYVIPAAPVISLNNTCTEHCLVINASAVLNQGVK
nr:glucosyltransferase domain-containing protein [Pantoea cypripedii]